MWHEARKHEKKIRGIMIDHRRRAEKRREFYASIRRDPASYLQIHGQKMPIHIDPAISQAAESSLVPWIGDGDQQNMIDRFDVRANLDCIPTSVDASENLLSSDQECQLNYERFRGLIQNDFLDNSEEKVLQNIFLKERWAPAQQQQQPQSIKSKIEMKKKLAEKKAAIGYNYDVDPEPKTNATANDKNSSSDSEGSDDDEDDDEDMDTIVLVDQLDPDMCQRLDIVAKKYGVKSGSFMKFMQSDKSEADRIRLATEIEHEKSMFVGRKSRRARKNILQQRLMILRSLNSNVDAEAQVDHFGGENGGGDKPPRKSKSQDDSDSSNSRSSSSSEDDDESKSEVDEGKIEFITSFGNDEADVDDPNSKKFQKKMRKLERKRLKESKKKITKHSGKFKQQQSSSETLMYGPSLPMGLIDAKKESDHDNVRFKHSSTNSSQIKNRHYRFNKDSEEDVFDRSPEHRRRIRRSPSVRRRRSSEDEDNVKLHRRQDQSPIRRYHSPPSRYRSSNDHKTSHRNRSRSRSRNRTRSYRSPEPRRATFRSSRSPIDRKRSKEKNRSKDRRRSRSKSPVSSHSQKRMISSPDRMMEKKVDPAKQEDESNEKLYKLLEKIENNVKKAAATSKSSQSDVTKNVTLTKPIESVEKDQSPPIKRYYRHDLVDKPDSGESDSDELNSKTYKSGTDFNPEETSIVTDINNQSTKSITNFPKEKTFAPSSAVKTPQERLKRLMQAQLDKQYELDKKAETDRIAKQKMEQLERDEEISKLASRRRETHRTRSRSRSSNSSTSDSSENHDHGRHRRNYSRKRYRSPSGSPSYSQFRRRHHSRRHRSRTRSRSPRIPHRSSNRYRRSSSRSH